MECINHQGVQAAGTCQKCGKALCADCANRFSPPLCEPCLLVHNDTIARSLYVDLGITAAIFIGIYIFSIVKIQGGINSSVFLGLACAAAYWGWKFINSIPVPIFLLTGYGMILYALFKFIFAILAGVLVAPWQIFVRVKEIRRIQSLKKKVVNGEA